jgi:uncharacterized membrane protein YeaQ/YmgE (transglycosylase-associated protein family)
MVAEIISWIIIGIIAGWLASHFVKGHGFGLVGDLILGIIGAIIGGFLFGMLGLSAGGWLGSLIVATIGAIILLGLVRLIKRA